MDSSSFVPPFHVSGGEIRDAKTIIAVQSLRLSGEA